MSEELEARAKRMGWVPKEEFRGDPERWVDAEKFVDRGQEMMPILKENLSRMEKKFEGAETKIGQLQDTLEKVVKLSKSASDRAYKRALRDLKGQQREAADKGDVVTFDAIENQLQELNESAEVAPGEKKEIKETGDGLHPDFTPWHKVNIWYGQDKDLTAYANGVAQIVAADSPGIDGKQFYDEITKRVKEVFPHKFENPNRKKADVVEGGGGGDDVHAKKKKAYRDLPAEAKAACDQFVKDGLFKNAQGYVDEYFEGEE